MILSQKVTEAFKAHVLAEYPNEACGLVIADAYYPCKNTSPEPTKTFRMEMRERTELEIKHGPITALLHSHPYELSKSRCFYNGQYNPAWPTEVDQASFLEDNVPWGIVATGGEGITDYIWMNEDEIAPFERRTFGVFVADCYTCVRDWHRINTGIVMPNVVRKYAYWEEGLNIIEDNLVKLKNATKYPVEKAQRGDIAVFAMNGSKVINHMGVVLGDNKFFHHFALKYPHETRWDSFKHWAKYIFRLTAEQ
jgi:cell wall-associated NlpC family hydrolase